MLTLGMLGNFEDVDSSFSEITCILVFSTVNLLEELISYNVELDMISRVTKQIFLYNYLVIGSIWIPCA